MSDEKAKEDRCGRPVCGSGEQKCVKPAGHGRDSLCSTEKFWCVKHDKCRLSPDSLCFGCVIEALDYQQGMVEAALATVKRLSDEVDKLRGSDYKPFDESTPVSDLQPCGDFIPLRLIGTPEIRLSWIRYDEILAVSTVGAETLVALKSRLDREFSVAGSELDILNLVRRAKQSCDRSAGESYGEGYGSGLAKSLNERLTTMVPLYAADGKGEAN